MATAYYELGNRPNIEAMTNNHVGAFALHLTYADQKYEELTGTRLLSQDTAGVAKDAATSFAFSFPTDSDLITAWRQAEPYFGQIIPFAINPQRAKEVANGIGGIHADLVEFLPVFEEERIDAIADVVAQPQVTSDEEIIALRDSLNVVDPQQTTTVTEEPSDETALFDAKAKQEQDMVIKTPEKIAAAIVAEYAKIGKLDEVSYGFIKLNRRVQRYIDKTNAKDRKTGGKMTVSRQQYFVALLASYTQDTDSNAVKQIVETFMNGGDKNYGRIF